MPQQLQLNEKEKAAPFNGGKEVLTSDNVFVYGSLKNGFPLHGLLANAEFLGEGVTKKAAFKMFTANDAWPAVIQGNRRIKGEVYKVDKTTLDRLDMAEGVPHLFERKLLKVKGFHGLANVYIAADRLENVGKRLQYESPRIRFDKRYNYQEWVNAQ